MKVWMRGRFACFTASQQRSISGNCARDSPQITAFWLRLAISLKMGLGDVSKKNYPKMTLIAPPEHGGALTTRSFIPHVCHDAIGVLAAVTVGTACVLKGSVCEGVAHMPAVQPGQPVNVSVEHPTGEFSVALATDPADPQTVTQAALLRTARLLMRGEVMVPRAVWAGR